MSESPFISVIITAYNRKEFLLKAVNSVLMQSLPREKYEVIVLKNFYDDHIDQSLEQDGVVNILDTSENVGMMLYKGYEMSNGEIITYLDDDDLFNHSKLEIVYNNFKDDEELTYYHNSNQLIDSEDKILPKTLRPIPDYPIKVQNKDIDAKIMKSLSKYGVGFNISSISIRRSVIREQVSSLKDLSQNTDSFMFYFSLDSPGSLLVDNKILTYYRIHSRNTSTSVSNSADGQKSITKYHSTSIRSLEMIKHHVKSKMIKKFLACSVLEANVKFHMSTKDVEENIPLNYLWKNVRCAITTGEKYRVLLGIWSLIYRISPTFARNRFTKSSYNKSKEINV